MKKILTAAITAALLCSLGLLGGPAHAADKQPLTPRESSIVTVAAFTAQGDLENLRPSLNQALDAGMTVNEVKEVLLHLYAYSGFPRDDL